MKNEMETLFQLNVKKNKMKIERKLEQIVLEPFDHINEKKGKGFRNMVIKIFNFWLQVDDSKTKMLTGVIHNLHTLTLLIDDIQDSSDLRRGNPTAHIIYGTGRTITTVDYLLFQTYYMMEHFENSKMFNIILDFFMNTLKGQTMEVYWRDNFICPTEIEYLDMISKKTGSTCECISKTLELLSSTGLNLLNVSILLGLYFQINDDYQGLKSKIYSDGKGYCDDIREGKFSHPIIHGINSNPNDKRILDILKMHTNDVDLKNECLELLEKYGSLQYTANKIHFYRNLLLEEVNKFELNPYFKILCEITEGTNNNQ